MKTYSKFRRWTRTTIIVSAIFILFSTLFFSLLLYNYPWEWSVENLSSKREGLFVENWPISAIKEELQVRKTMKRFDKKEQARRLGIISKRMQTLYSSLLDANMDSALQVVGDESSATLGNGIEMDWPQFETQRGVQGKEYSHEKIRYILLPGYYGTRLAEAISLFSGDELKLQIPISKIRRSLVMSVIPQTSGVFRAYLGQHYSWSRTFLDSEINQVIEITIPILDDTLETIRINASSTNFYVVNLKVIQREMTARLPIQIPEASELWQNKVTETEETPQAAQLDPLDDVKNEVTKTQQDSATAVGYNVVWVQMDGVPSWIFSDKKYMEKMFPNLAEIVKSGFVIENRFDLAENDKQVFFDTLFSENKINYTAENQILRQMFSENDHFNLLQVFRNFGYHVTLFDPADFLGLDRRLSWGKDFPNLGSRWLTLNDGQLWSKKVEIDQLRDPNKGLEAVFSSEGQKIVPSINSIDTQNIQETFRNLSVDLSSFPDWKVHELFVPDQRGHYYAGVIDAFQKWTKESYKYRFFSHIFLPPPSLRTRPTLKDFWQVFQKRRINFVFDYSVSRELVKVNLQDRTLGALLSTLQARYIKHRTILALLIQTNARPVFVLYIPGLQFNKNAVVPKTSVTLNDIVATTLSSVGITAGKNVANANVTNLNGYNLISEKDGDFRKSHAELPTHESTLNLAIKRFDLFIKAGKTGCQPLQWVGDDFIFGLRSSSPIVEQDVDQKSMVFFPCAMEGMQHIHWYQKTGTQKQIADRMGGTFEMLPSKGKEEDNLPADFFFGGQFWSPKSIPFYVFHNNPKKIPNVFDLGKSLDDQEVAKLKESFHQVLLGRDPKQDSSRTAVYLVRSTAK